MKRLAIFAYGILCYAVFFATFLYAIAFVGDLPGVPRTIDGAPRMASLPALLIDLVLLALFAVQHSLMARPAFKALWTRIIPAAAERSTYELFSSLALILLFRFWQPLGGQVWSIHSTVGQVLMGWFFAIWCTPQMSMTHMLFALVTAAYILTAIRFEEHDLLAAHPEYADYRRRVPMLLPRLRTPAEPLDEAI